MPSAPAKAAAAKDPKFTTVRKVYGNTEIVNAATGRWGEVAGEIKAAEPYQVDRPDGLEPIIILPLTRRRRRALKNAQAAYLLSASKLSAVTSTGEDDTEAADAILRIEKLTEDAERMYDQALFGDETITQAIYDYFDDQQEEFWDAFYQDVHDALVNRVELPEGTCSKCGHTQEDDDETAGKDESSSTSSTATGTK